MCRTPEKGLGAWAWAGLDWTGLGLPAVRGERGRGRPTSYLLAKASEDFAPVGLRAACAGAHL